MRIKPRAAVILTSLAVLWLAASGYTSCIGQAAGPSPRQIEANPPVIELTAALGGSSLAARSVVITPASVPGLTAATHYAGSPPAQWLTTEITTTSGSVTLLLTISLQGLSPGAYHATVTIDSSLQEVVPGHVDVFLTVTP